MYSPSMYIGEDTRMKPGVAYLLGIGLALASSLFLMWMMGALGVLGVEGDPADRMYFGVFAVGLIGALIARFRSRGMAHTMFAMAAAQALVAVIALAMGLHLSPASSIAELLGVNGIFVVLFGASGLLFWQAAGNHKAPGGIA